MRKKKMEHKLIKKRKKWPWILLTLVLLIVLSIGAFWWKYGYEIKNTIADGYSYSQGLKKSDFHPRNSTVIYDRNGKVIKKLAQSSSDYTPINKINTKISKGLVDVEDQRFYIHHGVDLYAIMRSVGSTLLHRRTEGGSTLTQQLVKNVILQDQSQNLTRKLKEMVIAQQLEKKFTKSQILEFYINNVYMGHGSYGFSAASDYYFSEDQNDLSIDKIAMLVGIPNNPVYYDPVQYPERTKKRRNMILYIFNQRGLISKKTYQTARKKPLGLKLNEKKYDNDVSNNYALSYAVYGATEELMKSSGFTMRYDFKNAADRQAYDTKYQQEYERAHGQLMDGGYTIQTTIDMDVQNKVENLIKQVYSPYTGRTANGKLTPQVSSTVVDNKTGDVIAVVGGRTTDGDQFNRTINGYHQPGSTAKPIVAYAPAFERGYLPQSTVIDSAVGNPVVHNWYSGYTGSTTVRHALENSINTIAYKLAAQDTKGTYYDDMVKMEFARLSPTQKLDPRLAIGSFRNGVTTTEMASAYSSFSRGGQFIHPSNISSIYDNDNDRYIYQNTHMKKDVYTKNASYMMINTMQSVISDGLGKDAALDNYKYTAGKTGSTDDNYDSYFVGMTPDFTIANWTGDDKKEDSLNASERQLAMKAFKSVGEYLVDEMKQKNVDFKKPSTVTVSGSNLSVNTKAEKPSIQDIIDNDFSKYSTNQANKNENRLYNLDYRIIYHLTKKEEFKRERKVQKAIDKYNDNPIIKESQYNKKLDELQKIRYLNSNVKRQSAKNDFNKQILQLQKDLNLSQAMFQAAKDNKKVAQFESEKEAIEEQREKKRQNMVDKLMPQYNSQLQKVKDAYKNNDSDKEDQKQKLIDIMNEIRSYGGNVPDLKIDSNGNSTSTSTSTTN
ncbi:transglycosylase domain-containing protein [Companilactobacillus pabuli]|jgi:penicillin-binding protein 1A|uniref:transglycosylase domain-containing protein n=1 Tax=Companilactobacillus pabuli TaxID=2714036 RepID=UPI00065B18CD|nr:transglycosylase domain-containing protein [Companilactobacillus pabuli]AKP02897.1 glycosyl transferase family 51 [Companilactobacillus farciminis]AKS51197.1 glycosyl transferase family 51 [Companilactobacillus farciminis]MDG5111965.1 transglycosylase domain-containing protein [Companilactobacillus pabuli]